MEQPITLDQAAVFITVLEAAELVRVSEPTIRRYLTTGPTSGGLTRYKFGTRTLIKRSELLALIREEPSK